MNREAKEQYMDTLRVRYFKAGKKGKGEILNEYCRNTGADRKYVSKKFNYKVKLKGKDNRKKRACYYDGTIIAALVEVWKIFDYPCGQRLEEILDTEIDNLRQLKELVCSDEVAGKLKCIKSATIDRRLNREKEVLKLKERYRKRSSFLLSTIPVKTIADFDRTIVGNIQVDFVESCGSSAAEKEGLGFSRSRPYHKNDNCFIEQKNSTHVRQVIGYLRYDTNEELDCLNDLYQNELRLYKNFFQPVIKLESKERIGGHIKRKKVEKISSQLIN